MFSQIKQFQKLKIQQRLSYIFLKSNIFNFSEQPNLSRTVLIMINNQQYLPDKPTLSQSKVFNDVKSTSGQFQNRNEREFMYSSGIFLKNSTVIYRQNEQQNYFQSYNLPLSPHKPSFLKPPNIQFSSNNNLNGHLNGINAYKPIQIPIYNHHENIIRGQHRVLGVSNNNEEQRGDYYQKIKELQDNIQMLSKKVLQIQRKQKFSSKNSFMTLDDEEIIGQRKLNSNNHMKDDFIINSKEIKQVHHLKEMKDKQYFEDFEKYKAYSLEQNLKIWKKINEFQELLIKINSQNLIEQSRSNEKISFSSEQQIFNRIKYIQKSIREMGQDIHLINDKEEKCQLKFQNEFIQINKKIAKLINNQNIIHAHMQHELIKPSSIDNSIIEMTSNEISLVRKEINSIEKAWEIKLGERLKQIEAKAKTKSNDQQDSYRPSLVSRYYSQPIILKYLEKFQVIQPKTHSHSQHNESFEININCLTYYIDNEGYILDNDRFYLINSQNNEKIKLDKKHIQCLKMNRILI